VTLLEAAMDAILAMPFVDQTRVAIGGQSRGGILSVMYAGRRPDRVRAVINFSGGWHGMLRIHAVDINQALFKRGSAYHDIPHARASFAAFQPAGGRGTFVEFEDATASFGHWLVRHPERWRDEVNAYLTRRGL
jgi:pimeloyl-ACP methyl ester carboxylesterase